MPGLAWREGVFALIIALGIVSEFADQTRTARHIFWYEDAVSAGAILGNAISVYQIVLPLGQVGQASLACFPVSLWGAWGHGADGDREYRADFTRRMDLRRGLGLMIASMAAGRTIGSFLYYYFRF